MDISNNVNNQTPQGRTYSVMVGDKDFIFETGKLAEQAERRVSLRVATRWFSPPRR